MKLAIELRSLVHESVALLGQVIKRKLGTKAFQRIEDIRQEMAELRNVSDENSIRQLQQLTKNLGKCSIQQRYEIACAFTLMLELMNASENAYRSFRLAKRQHLNLSGPKPESITYVLTAHPTEARSPQNVSIFHQIQNLLTEILEDSGPNHKIVFSLNQRNDLLHLLEIAWCTPIVRHRSPNVKAEAEYIYSLVFRDDVIFWLIEANQGQILFQLNSWVGGDKDGHPGVDDRTLMQSLILSRAHILKLIDRQLMGIRSTLNLVACRSLDRHILQIQSRLKSCRILKFEDFKRIKKIRESIIAAQQAYQDIFGSLHPQFRKISQLMELFPALVIPLELRESSDVLMSKQVKGKSLAIERMLQKIAGLCRGGDPKAYARGFIVSMTESVAHLKAAAQKQTAAFGEISLPIIPLFEGADSLANSHHIMKDILQDVRIRSAIKKFWDSKVEMMVGYSDSSKEAGVWPSRWAIAEALPKLEKICKDAHLIPVFFHGSGGSVDRGGGNIEDQTAWWPRSGVLRYKVTVQGEMIERSLASPMIAQRQLEKIAASAGIVLRKPFCAIKNPTLDSFAQKIAASYGKKITSPEFLQIVATATPYSYINILKIGSRPAKRTKELTVKGLRAIPWILCWTQTRLLLPTWWGVGTVWRNSSSKEKQNLKKAYNNQAAFRSYVKALDFTLAKVELAVFKTYLSQSNLPADIAKKFAKEVEEELRSSLQFCKAMNGAGDLLSNKRWLKESIQLRSPMIHPLNILQILAQKNRELPLLRLTVTGISSGMMTTG